ncbi:TetR/AcrR family transcriptional regulator [Knoellia sp. CPCC 206453]|uniref:TetR/AcrR family transcriptional regulator n=1 Tax=Knoellia pratensis TaxID=3404796 RepID=UPI00361B5666
MSRGEPQDETTREDGRHTRWDGHRAQRRDNMLRTAINAIERRGSEIAVAQIAAEAGIPRSVVYRLFRNREDLDEQIRVRIIEDLMSELEPALNPEGTIREAISDAIAVHVGWVSRHPALHQFLGVGAVSPSPGAKIVAGTRTAIAVYLAALLDLQLARLGRRAVPAGTAENVAFGIVGLVDGSVNRWVSRPPELRTSVEDLTEFLCDTVWGTLAGAATRLGIELDPDFSLAGEAEIGTPLDSP